jgi:hypothetical protein
MTSKAPSFVKLAGSATFDLRAYCPYWPSPLIHTVAPSVPPLESGWGAFAERRRTMRAHRIHAPLRGLFLSAAIALLLGACGQGGPPTCAAT